MGLLRSRLRWILRGGPAGLRALLRRRAKPIHHLSRAWFQGGGTSATATQRFAQDPRLVCGQIGMVGDLHTWGASWPTTRTCPTWFLLGAWLQMGRHGCLPGRTSCLASRPSPGSFAPSSPMQGRITARFKGGDRSLQTSMVPPAGAEKHDVSTAHRDVSAGCSLIPPAIDLG